MRCLERNKQSFWYALFLRKNKVLDDNGKQTGEYSIDYATPVRIMGNVSSARGETSTNQFGDSLDYDRVIVLDAPEVVIDEYSVLWIDTTPVIVDGVTETPYDYTVKKVARSLNSVSIAVKKVQVS